MENVQPPTSNVQLPKDEPEFPPLEFVTEPLSFGPWGTAVILIVCVVMWVGAVIWAVSEHIR